MKTALFLLTFAVALCFFPTPLHAQIGDGDELIALQLLDSREIWSGSFREPGGVFDDHSAFTDLVRFDGDLYVAFRESTGHVPGTNGRGAVLRSTDDGTTWERVADLRKEDFPAYDLRDIKLTVTPAGELMAYTAGANYTQGSPADRRVYASLYDPQVDVFGGLVEMQPTAGSQFQETQSDWLWRMTWNNDTAYGIGYRASDQDASRDSFLYTSTDGIHWDTVTQVVNPLNRVGEVTIQFDDQDNMYLISRGRFLSSGEANNLAWIGTSSPDTGYTEFTWTPLVDENGLHRQLGGPNMVILPNGEIIVASRKPSSEGTSDGENKTNLAQITLDGTWRDILELPSRGDTSYAGLVLEDDKLLVSYYAGPPSGGDPHIYFAEVAWSILGPPWNGIDGDINQDGVFFGNGSGLAEVDDLTAFIENWASENLPGLADTGASYRHGDVNFDGRTDLTDAYLLRQYYFQAGSSPAALDRFLLGVPEPASLAAWGIAGVVIAAVRSLKRAPRTAV